MEVVIIIIIVIVISLLIYTQTKNYRESRERILIYSPEFENLTKKGFKTEIINNKTIYVGKYNKYNFAIFIDSDDAMSNTVFSIVFSVTYVKFDTETFKKLNNEYYNRIKSLLLQSENLFFYEDFAQFRYSNSTLKIPRNKILKKLNTITEILVHENLSPREMTDINTIIARAYE